MTSYSELGEKVLGAKGKKLVDACLLVKQLSSSMAYLYFVATQLDFIICQYYSQCLGNKVFIVMLIIPVIVLSSAGSYKILSYLSIPSIFIAVTGMMSIFYYSSLMLAEGVTSKEPLKYFELSNTLGRIGLAMYLFDGIIVIVNVSAEAGANKARYPSILMKAALFDLILFLLFGSICYYVYREHSQPIFSMSLLPINAIVFFIFVCVCVNALTSYPVHIIAALNIIEKTYQTYTAQSSLSLLKRVTIRGVTITVTTLLCMLVPTFTDFINIAGSVGSMTVVFILPQIFFMNVYGQKMSALEKVGCWAIGLFGLFGGSYSIYFSIVKLARKDYT